MTWVFYSPTLSFFYSKLRVVATDTKIDPQHSGNIGIENSKQRYERVEDSLSNEWEKRS